MKILLIEDSKTLQKVTSNIIRRANHHVKVVNTGELALQALENERFDLIISDVDMPGLNGYETVRLIREMLGELWVPIIYLTSRDEDADYIEGFSAGGDDYLIKPVREVILLGKIRVMERFINMQNRLSEVISAPEPVTQFDPLTNVYNNPAFLDMAYLQWQVMARRKEPLSLLAIDIDYFSIFKERYGKKAAENCLVSVARTIQAAVNRPNDFIGRFSDSGFIMMLPNTCNRGALMVANRISQSIEELNIESKVSPISGVVTSSIAGVHCLSLTNISLQDSISALTELLNELKCDSAQNVRVVRFD